MASKSYRESHTSKDRGKIYDSVYTSDTYDSRVWKLEKKLLEKDFARLNQKPVKNYLDFACGTGRILEIFEKKSINTIGIDVSKEMLKEATEKYQNTQFIISDITKNRRIFNHKFELITAFRFFYNAEDILRKEVLQVLYKLLKENGIFICNTHGNRNKLNIFTYRQNRKTLSFEKMKNLLEQHHFDIIKIYGISYLPYLFSKFLPEKIWLIIEKVLIKIKYLKKFGTDIIFICRKN